MRILIQDSISKTYFDGVGWREDMDLAMGFETVNQAEACCRSQNFNGALIVVKSKDPNQDVSYPAEQRGSALVSRPPTTKIKSLY